VPDVLIVGMLLGIVLALREVAVVRLLALVLGHPVLLTD
jgi:hypothetical protein